MRFHRSGMKLRRKINDVQPQLPPSVRGRSVVIDDFGDVYGNFLAITGDGFSQPELRRYADFLRSELLLVPGVKKAELFAEQQEVVFLEISRRRLAVLGINETRFIASFRRETSPLTADACASESNISRSIPQGRSNRLKGCSNCPSARTARDDGFFSRISRR
jgi:multidrug efflux pump subunit AcrB